MEYGCFTAWCKFKGRSLSWKNDLLAKNHLLAKSDLLAKNDLLAFIYSFFVSWDGSRA